MFISLLFDPSVLAMDLEFYQYFIKMFDDMAYLSDEFWKEVSPIEIMLSFMVEFMDCKMSN